MEVLRDSVRDVGARTVDVDLPEKIFLHELPVRLRVVGRQADVLVEVEGRDAAEIEPFVAMQSDQLLIESKWRAAGRESEHGGQFLADNAGNDLGAEHATGLGGIAD